MKSTVVGVGSIRSVEEQRRYDLGEDKRRSRAFRRQILRMANEAEAARRAEGRRGTNPQPAIEEREMTEADCRPSSQRRGARK